MKIFPITMPESRAGTHMESIGLFPKDVIVKLAISFKNSFAEKVSTHARLST
jgi:hypothetical protein